MRYPKIKIAGLICLAMGAVLCFSYPAQARRVRDLSPPSNIRPTGLLVRGIRNITGSEYEFIRNNGFLPKDEGGVSKDPDNYSPGNVSLSLSRDDRFDCSSLTAYGPLEDPGHVVFIIDPAYVKQNAKLFTLFGYYFEEDYGRNRYIEGLELLGLDNRSIQQRVAYPDEIQAKSIPPSAIIGIIASRAMAEMIIAWDNSSGFTHLPIYILEEKGVKEELLPYESSQ